MQLKRGQLDDVFRRITADNIEVNDTQTQAPSRETRRKFIAAWAVAGRALLLTASGLSVVLEFFSGWAPRPVLEPVYKSPVQARP
jgi:hypothetical protein